jgi:soluble lytic murein transglycosylase
MKMNLLTFSSGLILSLSISTPCFAALESVTLTSKDPFPAPRWMYGVGQPPKASEKDPTFALIRVKQAQSEGDFNGCAERARAARPKAKSLQSWLTVVGLECAVKAKPTLKSGNELSHAVDDASAHADWFLLGAQSTRLKSAFSAGLSALIDQDLKVNRARAWKSIERIDEYASVLDDKTKALGLRAAGDLSVAQSKPEAARSFYKRSVALQGDPETREKLANLERSLGVESAKTPSKISAKEVTDVAPSPTPSELNVTSETTSEELEMGDRVTSALKSGDIVVAMELATQIIQKFPGGSRAKWAADRVQETLASFADKTDIKYKDIHDQILERIQKADADRLTEWARVCYNRAQFQDAFVLAKKSLSTVDGARRTKSLELASQAAIAVEAWDVARSTLQELIDKSAGQPQSREALFRLGLLNYREQKYNDAITSFERLLSLPQAENFELSSRYWLWRSLQKTKSERATKLADELMTKYPFSYYGLRARLEQGKGSLEWKPAAKEASDKVESVMWLEPAEKIAWEKAQILMRAGWLDEAQSELRELPSPLTANDKAVRSLVWAAAGGYVTASRLANDAWDENSEFRRAPFTDAVFPHDFTEFVEANAKKRGLDRDLVRGLIKQESSYNPKAISTSNAYGLMQMIPPTAKEIAQDLHLGTLKLPDDMFVPKRNIEMGTYYLSRQVTHYGGSVPLALASYNAGPGRIDRWLRTRPSLAQLSSTKSSAPDDEIWFDEIPYNETCFYVKAILRNIMLYRLLDQGRASGPWTPPDPIWSMHTTTAN